MLASDSGEIDRARFRLNLGVTRGLENRDTVGKRDFVRQNQWGCCLPAGGQVVRRPAAFVTAVGC